MRAPDLPTQPAAAGAKAKRVSRRGFLYFAGGTGLATALTVPTAAHAEPPAGKGWKKPVPQPAPTPEPTPEPTPTEPVTSGTVAYCPIDPSDGRDVTAELTAWLNSLPSNTTADLLGREYRSETAIKLADKVGLTIRNGTLRRTVVGALVWPTPNPHLWLLRPTACAVQNLQVHGTNVIADQRAGFGAYKVEYEFEAAVRMEQFKDCAITGLVADGIWGDGVQWQVGSGGRMADSRIDRVGRQGVTLIGSNLLVEGVRVEHGRRSGFDLEPDTATQGVSEIEIRACYTNSIGLPFASAGRGPVNNVYIHHNTTAGPSVPVLYVRASDGSRRSNWRFEDNVAIDGLGSPAEAIRFVNVDGFAVIRNRLPVNSTQSRLAVGADGCGGALVIKDNDFGYGDRYFNRNPAAGQELTISGGTPLTVIP